MTLGERIKQRRKALGLSADYVGEKLGVSRATIFRYESGATEKIPISKLEPLAIILQTTPAYLAEWIDYSDLILEDKYWFRVREYLDNYNPPNKNEIEKLLKKGSLSSQEVNTIEKKLNVPINYFIDPNGFEVELFDPEYFVRKIAKKSSIGNDGGLPEKKRALIEAILKLDDSDIDVVTAAADALIARRDK